MVESVVRCARRRAQSHDRRTQKQHGAYSTPQEDTANWKFIEEEKNREDEVYRENIDKARQTFIRAKNMRDDLAAQVRSLSTDSDDTLQQIKTIRTTIENIDNSLIRWNQDMKTHQKSFEAGLSAERQGSSLVAVTYTVDVKDTQNALDHLPIGHPYRCLGRAQGDLPAVPRKSPGQRPVGGFHSRHDGWRLCREQRKGFAHCACKRYPRRDVSSPETLRLLSFPEAEKRTTADTGRFPCLTRRRCGFSYGF